MVSMKEIALKCGVSVATVSKALNDQHDISEATKKKVRQTARELGYLPNSFARALKTNRTFNLGVLFVDEAQNGLTHDYFARVLNSFMVTAEEQGYDLTFINSRKRKMTYLEHSRYRGMDGVVIACVNFDSAEVRELVHSDLPVVTIDHSFNDKPAVISDNIAGMRDLVTYVYQCGHRKIAYIHGEEHTAVTKNRVGSFFRTLQDLNVTIPDEYLKSGNYRNPEMSYQLTQSLMELPDPPTCILYPDDLASIGGYNALRERGLRIPEDISIAGYDGLAIGQMMDPTLTTIMQDTATIGACAARQLIDMIEHPKTTLFDRVSVPGRLLTGKSVASPR